MYGIDLLGTSASRWVCLSAATRLLDEVRGRSLNRLGQLGPISLAQRTGRLLNGSAIMAVGEGGLEQVLLLVPVSRFAIATVVEVGACAVLSKSAVSCGLAVGLSMGMQLSERGRPWWFEDVPDLLNNNYFGDLFESSDLVANREMSDTSGSRRGCRSTATRLLGRGLRRSFDGLGSPEPKSHAS